ncbi:MAG: hypothetical protein RLZZ117_558 [Cyanobacteriota bacterium]
MSRWTPPAKPPANRWSVERVPERSPHAAGTGHRKQPLGQGLRRGASLETPSLVSQGILKGTGLAWSRLRLRRGGWGGWRSGEEPGVRAPRPETRPTVGALGREQGLGQGPAGANQQAERPGWTGADHQPTVPNNNESAPLTSALLLLYFCFTSAVLRAEVFFSPDHANTKNSQCQKLIAICVAAAESTLHGLNSLGSTPGQRTLQSPSAVSPGKSSGRGPSPQVNSLSLS